MLLFSNRLSSNIVYYQQQLLHRNYRHIMSSLITVVMAEANRLLVAITYKLTVAVIVGFLIAMIAQIVVLVLLITVQLKLNEGCL